MEFGSPSPFYHMKVWFSHRLLYIPGNYLGALLPLVKPSRGIAILLHLRPVLKNNTIPRWIYMLGSRSVLDLVVTPKWNLYLTWQGSSNTRTRFCETMLDHWQVWQLNVRTRDRWQDSDLLHYHCGGIALLIFHLETTRTFTITSDNFKTRYG